MAFKIENGVLELYTEEKGITEVVIPDGVTVIDAYAFSDCKNIKSIIIPDSVTCIDDGAFYRCDNLTSITIPEGVTSINDFMFGRCHNLTSINIPDGVTSIGRYAFAGCENLESITIPDSVVYVNEGVFFECEHLTSITIEDEMSSLTFGINKEYYKGSVPVFELLWEVTKFILEKDFEYEYLYLDECPFYKVLIIDYMLTFNDVDMKSYIEENAEDIINHLIDNDDVDRMNSVINSTNALTESNIIGIIDYAIENTQNGGSIELQAMLMHYKNEHFNSDDNPQKFEL